jgi:GntR family transcriptional regulator
MPAVTHDSAEPLYTQIRDLILDGIRSGRYAVHQRLPSERELSVQHGVSRMTVRQAVLDLQREGVIYARVGKGTFVSPPKMDQLLRQVTSFTEEVRQRGEKPSSRVLQAVVGPADADSSRELGLADGAPVITLARLRLANGAPLAVETANLPAGAFPGLLSHDFAAESLYQVLTRDYHLTLVAARQTIEAALASDEEARLLDTAKPAPVLRMRRLTRDSDGRAVEFVVSTYRGDRYQLHSNLEPAPMVGEG